MEEADASLRGGKNRELEGANASLAGAGGGFLTFQEVDHLAPFSSIKRVQLLQAHESDVVTWRIHDGPAFLWYMLVQLCCVRPSVCRETDADMEGGLLVESSLPFPIHARRSQHQQV